MRILKSQSGQSATEYGLILFAVVTLIMVLIISNGGAGTLTSKIAGLFTKVQTALP